MPSRYYPLIQAKQVDRPIRVVTFSTKFRGLLNPRVGMDFMIDGKLYSETVAGVEVDLNSVEEWHLTLPAGESEGHPFHIHVNHFEVISVNGVPEPGWTVKDTVWIPKPSATQASVVIMRTKFKEFTASAAENADGIYSSLTGTDGTSEIVDAINQLDADVKTGFENVVNAINDQTLINAWTPISTSLTNIYNQTFQYLQDLQSLKKATSGPSSGSYIVTSQTEEVLFTDWCQGDSGVLKTLASFIEVANYGASPGQQSLSGMFTTLESGNSALTIWEQIAKAAQTSTVPTLSKYQGQTVFDLVNKLMGEIFTILGMIYYVHDASLKLLNALSPSNAYVSIFRDIQTHFGNSGATGTVWNTFATELSTLTTTPQAFTGTNVNPINPQGQVLNASLSCDQYPGADAFLGSPPVWCCTAPYCITTPNSFITSLQILLITPDGGRDDDANWPTVILAGVPATISKNLALTSNGVAMSADIAEGWVREKWDSRVYHWNPGEYMLSYVHTLYATPPAPQTASNNLFSVVTGFCFCQTGNQLGIALQFGELDVSDLNNPTVTVTNPEFQQPVCPDGNVGYFDTPGYTDLRPAGAYTLDANGNAVGQLGIMTNASLMATYGNRVGLNVQMVASLYMADFFQPTNLPTLVPVT